MNSFIRLPAPLVFTMPLIFLFNKQQENIFSQRFYYTKEMFVFLMGAILLFLIALQSIKSFLVVLIIVGCCIMYFNYFIGKDIKKLTLSIWMFYALLLLSSVIMLLDHLNPVQITALRSMLLGEVAKQTPSGIAPYIFTFGYQLSALVSFAVISAICFRKHILIIVIVFGLSLVLILYGMNRSVLVTFSLSVGLFWILYYRFKALLFVGILICFGLLFRSSIEDLSTGRKENILAKNEKNADEHRESLMIENFKIIADNPFGLAFYGKSWTDVAKRNPAFRLGFEGIVTSHNAYLMFITYLGIVVGGLFLWLFYQKIASIFWRALLHIRKRENALMISLCFSFLAISLNSFFHNEWLLAGSGPTIFLYFCIMQLSKIQNSPESLNPTSAGNH
ncbi:O-antigen ligase family protein [Pedobacter sp. P351]|uniref:O-antigen ligase family protein n=1 Tax=Pedobacter superstes TaxID=3133441 RepID=UPI00309953CA